MKAPTRSTPLHAKRYRCPFCGVLILFVDSERRTLHEAPVCERWLRFCRDKTAIAEKIRLATSQNRLHPLVRDNWASPRGLCNCCRVVADGPMVTTVFCQRDYLHAGPHSNGFNGLHQWEAPWPPPELFHGEKL
jgi:hypothetical protein